MTTSGSDAAETMVRMALSGAEVSVKLTASAAKNMLAITIALAKNHKKLYGKTKLRRMLKETRDIRVFQMSAAQFKRFQRQAKRYKILYASVWDKSGQGGAIDLILPATELERANMVFERIRYGQDATPVRAPDRDRSKEQQPKKSDDPKNVSRSEPGFNDTRSKAKSGRPEEIFEPTRTTSERPSVAVQLEMYHQMIVGRRTPARTPERINMQKKRLEHKKKAAR